MSVVILSTKKLKGGKTKMYGIQESTANKERKIAEEVTKLYDSYATERNTYLGKALIASSEFVSIAENLSIFGVQEVRQCLRTGQPYGIIYIDSNYLPSKEIMEDVLMRRMNLEKSVRNPMNLFGVTPKNRNCFEIRPRRNVSLSERVKKFVDVEVDCRQQPSVRIM